MEYSALMAIEVGKNRIEALGEVEESADLIRYYAQTVEDNEVYDHPMGNLGDTAVHTRSILRPHGVFAVISPFNFPMALATGPTGAALMAGNTVVLKPSSASPLSAVKLIEAYIDAGVPAGVVNLVMGPGETVGQALQDHPGVDGIVFTGSYEVGMRAVPLVLAGLAAAVHRGDGWQEPGHRVASRGSRRGGRGDHAVGLRVRRPEVLGQLARLRRAAGPRRAGPPAGREDRGDHDRRPARPRELAGPDHRPEGRRSPPDRGLRGASRRHGLRRRRAAERRGHGSRLLRRADRRRRPAGVPSPVPRRAVRAVHRGRGGRLDRRGDHPRERLRLRPDGRRLQRGSGRGPGRSSIASRPASLYVNRRAGATTGAWPGIQAFGGWKGSGSTGKAGLSMYYVAQFMREQSHTIVD